MGQEIKAEDGSGQLYGCSGGGVQTLRSDFGLMGVKTRV